MSITSKTTCLLCKDDASDDPFVTVGKKGLDTLESEYVYVYVLVRSSFSPGHLRVVGGMFSNILFCSTILTASIDIRTAK